MTGILRRLYDMAGGFGGPLKRDRVWFFASVRRWESSSYQAGNYFNTSPNPRCPPTPANGTVYES